MASIPGYLEVAYTLLNVLILRWKLSMSRLSTSCLVSRKGLGRTQYALDSALPLAPGITSGRPGPGGLLQAVTNYFQLWVGLAAMAPHANNQSEIAAGSAPCQEDADLPSRVERDSATEGPAAKP